MKAIVKTMVFCFMACVLYVAFDFSKFVSKSPLSQPIYELQADGQGRFAYYDWLHSIHVYATREGAEQAMREDKKKNDAYEARRQMDKNFHALPQEQRR